MLKLIDFCEQKGVLRLSFCYVMYFISSKLSFSCQKRRNPFLAQYCIFIISPCRSPGLHQNWYLVSYMGCLVLAMFGHFGFLLYFSLPGFYWAVNEALNVLLNIPPCVAVSPSLFSAASVEEDRAPDVNSVRYVVETRNAEPRPAVWCLIFISKV